MKLKPVMIAISIIVIFFGGILLSSLFGWWNTSSGEGQGKSVVLTSASGIRGSSSFGAISTSFGIPLDDLAKAFGVSSSPATFQCKSLESLYPSLPDDAEIGTQSVKYFVSLYLGLTETPASLPDTALEVLTKAGKLSGTTLKEVEKYAVTVNQT